MDGGLLNADLTTMADSTLTAEGPGRSLLDAIEHYVGAVAMVAVCTLVGMWIAPRWGTAPVDMVYLPAVLAAAALWGFGPALVAGIAAALAYNFFFTVPVHTLRMDRVTDVVTVAVLLIVALVTSQLAAAIRAQARVAAAHAARNATIAGFARQLLSCGAERDIADSRSRVGPFVRLQRHARRRLARAPHHCRQAGKQPADAKRHSSGSVHSRKR